MKNTIMLIFVILLLIGCSSTNVEKVSTNETNNSKKTENRDGEEGNKKESNSSFKLKESFTAMDDVMFELSGQEKNYAVGDQLFIVDQIGRGNETVFNVSVAKHGKWESINKEVLISEELFAKADGVLPKDTKVEYTFIKDAFYRTSYEPKYIKEIENTSPIKKILYDNTIKIHKITFDTDASPIVEKIYEITVPQKHQKFGRIDNWSSFSIVETNNEPIYHFVTKESLEPTDITNGYIAQFISLDGKVIYEVKDQEIIKLFDIGSVNYFDLKNKLMFVNNEYNKSNVYSYKNNEFIYEENGAPSKLEPPKQSISINNRKKGFVIEQQSGSKGKIYEIITFEKKEGRWVKAGEWEKIKLNTNTIHKNSTYSIDNSHIYIFQEIEYKGEKAFDEHIISYK